VSIPHDSVRWEHCERSTKDSDATRTAAGRQVYSLTLQWYHVTPVTHVSTTSSQVDGETVKIKPELWAQRDGRPAEYRRRRLFNAAKLCLTLTTIVTCITLSRRETRWNYLGCPKLPNRSQPLVGRSSPYCEVMRKRYWCLTRFFRLSIHALVAKLQPGKVVRWCRDGDFLRPVFSASRV